MSIRLIEGDITQARVDAIVNAANPVMLGGGGVDGAIHAAAGPALLDACRRVKAIHGVRCPTGEARITTAGDLNACYVIHTVGPVYHTANDPEALLISCYRQSLALAQMHQCRSIAFPAISCGIYGYPIEDAADIALDICQQPEYSDLDIRFYLFGKTMYSIWSDMQ
jgi:O-acetyl-ADP-ribose deacetylase (regulator of RNase III)